MVYNMGELPLSKSLSASERREVLECFGEKRPTKQILFSENTATETTVLVFDEYYGHIDTDLDDLARWCKDNGVQIEDGSVVYVYSDEDGSYVYTAATMSFEYYDSDETTIRNADTDDLIAELERRAGEPFIEVKYGDEIYRLPKRAAQAAHDYVAKQRLREHVFELLADNQEISLATLTDEEKNAIADKIIHEHDLYVYDPDVLSEKDVWGMAIWDVLHQEGKTEEK